jgi:hypothetical protein
MEGLEGGSSTRPPCKASERLAKVVPQVCHTSHSPMSDSRGPALHCWRAVGGVRAPCHCTARRGPTSNVCAVCHSVLGQQSSRGLRGAEGHAGHKPLRRRKRWVVCLHDFCLVLPVPRPTGLRSLGFQLPLSPTQQVPISSHYPATHQEASYPAQQGHAAIQQPEQLGPTQPQ